MRYNELTIKWFRGVYVFIKHIHESYTPHTRFRTFFSEISIFVAHFANLRSVTTCVCVVYMLGKHIHAFNLLIINIFERYFGGVYVFGV